MVQFFCPRQFLTLYYQNKLRVVLEKNWTHVCESIIHYAFTLFQNRALRWDVHFREPTSSVTTITQAGSARNLRLTFNPVPVLLNIPSISSLALLYHMRLKEVSVSFTTVCTQGAVLIKFPSFYGLKIMVLYVQILGYLLGLHTILGRLFSLKWAMNF